MKKKNKNKIIFTYKMGTKIYQKNGKYHREDGPAIEYANGEKSWFLEGHYHRTDGPAVEYANGYKEWFLNGKKIECSSQEEFKQLLRLKAFW